MLKKTVVGLLVGLGFVANVNASDLKHDMSSLSSTLSAVRYGFLTNNKEKAIEALAKFKKSVDTTLGDKETITKLLPEALKYKADIAINSAEMIDKYIEEINTIAVDKNITPIKAQMQAQKAYLNIEAQCFRCHNLVRDWEQN
jgi:hypothetical protein